MTRGLRRAALALSAVGPRDRHWILARVGRAERKQLSALLAEVETLGLRVDADELARLSEDAPVAAPRGMEEPSPGPRSRLERAGAREMANVLRSEPDGVVAAVCALADWPWLSGFLEALREPRGTRVRRLMAAQATPGPATAEALLGLLVARLEAKEANAGFLPLLEDAAQTPSPRGLRASLSRLTSWLL